MNVATDIDIYYKLNTIKPKHLIKKNNTLQEKLQFIKSLEKMANSQQENGSIYKKDKFIKSNKGGDSHIIIYH